MLHEVLKLARPRPGEKLLDLTVGTAGHALALSREVGPEGFLAGLDRDPEALRVAKERLESRCPCRFRLFKCPFSRAPELAERIGETSFHVALADLGIGTHQMDDPERSFSFNSERKLDMRYDPDQRLTAWEVVNRCPQPELADIFYRLGEERYSRQIADAICRRRDRETIDTPAELAELIEGVVAPRSRGRRWRIHPATRVMMSLRIYVNDELEELEALLESLPGLLAEGGRALILTYHSLEARRVKEAWREQQRSGAVEILTPTPLTPGEGEIEDNPRARSCQLRAARKL